ncbi:MAG: hypothetical protein ACK5XN_16450 [Bacteroidota bacterium]|jgi:hypothetical protein
MKMNFIRNVMAFVVAVVMFVFKAIVWVAGATWAVIAFPFRAFAWAVEGIWNAVVFAGKTIVAIAVAGAVAVIVLGVFSAFEIANAIVG